LEKKNCIQGAAGNIDISKKIEVLFSYGSLSDVQGIQEIQNQMVLGLQNNPVDPYIIKKV
jgi:hypothetical protein